MKKERFEARLFRIFAQAGYSPVQLLTVTPEEMVENLVKILFPLHIS